jgi:hypothetical protein
MFDPIKEGDKVTVTFTGRAGSGDQWGQIELLVDQKFMEGDEERRKIYIHTELVAHSPSVLDSLIDSTTVANPEYIRAIEAGAP